ncbi:hypothetical protein DEO72_LG8g2231 [Vigna unguiculata]|uniref:Uncharacterized protein n=1 Tax=Vigna unguiculata TaxID=3917 RepID=A0A4D6MSZ5_VIGUN|nr:hypothetical protein DEO72_LG8g2231 [Vigna unguiculata]
MVKLRGFDITSYNRSSHSACMNKAEMGPENKTCIDLASTMGRCFTHHWPAWMYVQIK